MVAWFETGAVESVTGAVPEWAALVFAGLSFFGSVWFVGPVTVLAFWFGDRRRFGAWLGTVLGAYALTRLAKGLFAVGRPDVDPVLAPGSVPPVVAPIYAEMVDVSTASFPSGHTVAAVVVWAMIAREAPWGSRRARLVLAGGMVPLVGLGRVGSAVHYPIDVVAGIVVGLAYVGTVLVLTGAVSERVDRHTAASVTIALAAGLSALAFGATGDVHAAGLMAGSLGGLFAWTVWTPPASPGDRPVTAAVAAVAGVGLLGLAALVAVALDHVLAWFGLGLIGAVAVVTLPSIAGGVRKTEETEAAQKVSR